MRAGGAEAQPDRVRLPDLPLTVEDAIAERAIDELFAPDVVEHQVVIGPGRDGVE
jgi:hypothetical protein